MPPTRALLLVASLATVRGVEQIFTDAFVPGWSGAGYAPTSGAFNFSAAFAHLGTGLAIRAALAPYGSLVLRSAADVGASAAQVSAYINAGPAPDDTPRAAPLALGLSIATSLPGGASAPVASLCRVTQASVGAPALAAAPASDCTAGGADAAGWVRITMSVDGFGGAGWDELQLSDVSGAGGTVYIDDISLLSQTDVVQPGAWDANAGFCADRMDSILYGCTLPPSAECCADYAAFNAQRCYCIDAILQRGGADMQLATQYAAPDLCGTQLILPDDPLCFVAPPGAGTLVDGMPPLPGGGVSAASVKAPPTAAAARAPPQQRSHGGGAARAAAPYIGIVLVTAAGTAGAAAMVRRRVARVLREGRAEDSLLSERLLGATSLR